MDEKRDWDAGQAFCQSIGGRLPTVLSLEFNQFIFDALPNQTVPRWLGARRADVNSPFFWTSGEQESLAAGLVGSCTEGVDCLWLIGEPNNFGGGENCISIGHPRKENSDPAFRGGWNDAVCANARFHPCERDGKGLMGSLLIDDCA